MPDPITLPDSLTKHMQPVPDIEIIREAAQVISHAMERVHRAPFKFMVGHDCSFVFVHRVRDGGANG
ncbi:hypothetical protein ACTDI4_18085 [Mesorhizobium sp. PUT5]|uniref:hypothetical protein n=1 Tax=Mesorhizobium sp. PUT5 TaxID=3454629 RepID=UPI003FA4A5DD